MNKNITAKRATMSTTTHNHKEHTTAIAPFYSAFLESLHKEQWKEVRLGEVAEIVGGGTPKTSVPEYWGGNIAWLTPKDLTGYTSIYISKGERFITQEGLKNSSATVMPKGTILLSSRAPIGYVAIAQNDICTNQGFKSLIVKGQKANNLFIYYWIKNNTKYLQSLGTGTTFGEISKSVVENIAILLPPLKVQQQIAEILSSFDDKIDLLHRQNKTLESLALTLFRHTFIDNPNRNEWEEIKIGDYVECVNGYSYKSSELDKSNIALVTLKNFARDGSFNLNGFKEFIGTKFRDSQIVKNGDLVVAHTDITQEAEIIGNPALIIDTGKYEKLIITMDLVKVESKIEWLSKEFLYYLFKAQDFKSHCLGNSNGTTVLHMNRKTILEYTTKIPNPKVIMEFTKNVSYFFGKTYNNLLQIQSLQSMRDMLLAKILNDKMEV